MNRFDHDQIKEVITKSKSIVITSHKSPDGDAVGSSLALFHILKEHYNVSVALPDKPADFLDFLPGIGSIMYYDSVPSKVQSAISNADLIFCLDYNGLGRIGEMGTVVGDSDAKKVMIDHHQNPDSFFDLAYWDNECGSTCELIFDIITKMFGKSVIDLNSAKCLYTGILTDSGSFKYPSTTSHTHKVVADLIDKGVDHFDIHSNIYDTFSKERMALLGYAISEKLELFENDRVALISMERSELQKYKYEKGFTEGLVNYGLSLKGVEVAILLTQPEDDIKISFRSKGNIPVNLWAKELFGGGGHKNAAGAKTYGSVTTAKNKITSQLKSFLYKETI